MGPALRGLRQGGGSHGRHHDHNGGGETADLSADGVVSLSVAGRPNGYAQVLALGDPKGFITRDGHIDEAAWQRHLGLVTVDFPAPLPLSWSFGSEVHAIRCHPVSAEAWRRAFGVVYQAGLWPMLHTFGGGYNFRMQRGTHAKVSTHAWGLAGDFDVANNKLGERPQMDIEVVRIFQSFGFVWGGEWMRPDGMHFQFCSGY